MISSGIRSFFFVKTASNKEIDSGFSLAQIQIKSSVTLKNCPVTSKFHRNIYCGKPNSFNGMAIAKRVCCFKIKLKQSVCHKKYS